MLEWSQTQGGILPNLLPGSLDPDQYRELAARPEYKKFRGKCPTCQGTGIYVNNGIECECPEDYDHIHLQKKLFNLYELANIPMKYQRFDYEKDFVGQPEAREEIQHYLDNIDNCIMHGVGYYIYSPGLGTGKTAIATQIVKTAVKRLYDGVRHDCWFDSFFTLTNLIHLDDDRRRFLEHKFLDSHLLVIDDVVEGDASARQQAYFGDALERVIRHRAHNSLSTIVTTNLTPADLQNSYDRIFSLLADSCNNLELDSTVDTRISRGVNLIMNKIRYNEVSPIT
jgi:DNA replication protein DnaC